MAADKKIRKDKEIVVELEGQIKDIRQLLAEQLRCLDQHLDCHVGMLQDLQEYYRRHAEVEMEISKSLDKLGKQLLTRQKRDPLVIGYSTFSTWQILLESTRQQSRNYGFFSDIFHPIIVNKLIDLADDIQRIHKRCREMVMSHQEELFKVLTELENSMKTYHTYHGSSQQAESKLLRAQSQRVKVDQQNALSKKFINYDKKEEQKQAKYTENKLKATKARNEYLLSIDSANAALKKYFTADFPKLVEKMDFGYHTTLCQIVDIHITACCCLVNSDQERLNKLMNQKKNVISLNDNAFFRSQNQKLFVKPEDFQFQPHRGDEISQIAIQDETVDRMTSIKVRIDSNVKENEELLKELQDIEKDLYDRINNPDLDVVQIFRDEKTGLKSPTEKEKRREERLKVEDVYLQKLHNFMKADCQTARLNSKFVALHKAVGDRNFDTVHVIVRPPPSLLPKPPKCIKNGSQPKLFGGTIEEYVEATGTQIPFVIRSCIRIINLYGMHHQGIFRVPGSQNEINNYKQQFEKGIDPLTKKVEGDEINSVAGLLKLYFRELSEPLFPADKFSSLISIAEKFSVNEEESKSNLKAIMVSLPRPRMIVLRYLFAFLSHLTEFSDENMMDAYNLAVCFGPTLLPNPVSSDLSNHVYVNRLVELIISHHEAVFPCEDGDVSYEKFNDAGEKDFLDSVSDDDFLNSNLLDEEDEYDDREVVAEYDYQGRTDSELSFKKGDVLFLFKRASPDWWRGEFKGLKGLIPHEYIQIPKKRQKATNLKKGCAQAKSSDCLLSPEDISFSSSSSLDRCVSQPNVAVPVPPVPQPGIPASDQLPNVARTLQVPDVNTTEDDENALLSVDSALAKINDILTFIEKVDDGKTSDSKTSVDLQSPDTDLDVIIPPSRQTPSPSPGAVAQLSVAKTTLSSGVRKSTSFRDPSPSRPVGDIAQKNSDLGSHVDGADSESGDKRNSKSSTLPPNLAPPFSGMPGMSGFDSELLKEINTFSTFHRSTPVEVQKKAVPPPRPKPPAKKAVDSNKTAMTSNIVTASSSVKASSAVSSPETTGKK